jgi:hypothetical protein
MDANRSFQVGDRVLWFQEGKALQGEVVYISRGYAPPHDGLLFVVPDGEEQRQPVRPERAIKVS